MCAAIIELGWVLKLFEGESAIDILHQVEEYQDFGCLIYMGRRQENSKGQEALTKLETFLKKYSDGTLTMKDLKNYMLN